MPGFLQLRNPELRVEISRSPTRHRARGRGPAQHAPGTAFSFNSHIRVGLDPALVLKYRKPLAFEWIDRLRYSRAIGEKIMSKYLFIDGASLQETLNYYQEALYPGIPIDIDYSQIGYTFDRIFYYDCLPAQGTNESDSDFDTRLKSKVAFFEKLHTLTGWHVSQGIQKRGGKKSPPQQKEVDILIAVDVLSHTYRKNMSSIALITSDLDFRPLLEEVGRAGMFSTLMYQPGHTNADLLHAADERVPITGERHSLWLGAGSRSLYPWPTFSKHSKHSAFKQLENPWPDEPEKTLYFDGSSYRIAWPDPNSEGKLQAITHISLEHLKRIYRHLFRDK